LHETVRRGNTALAAGNLEAADEAMQQVMAMTYTLGLDDTVEAGGSVDAAQSAALSVLVAAQLADRAAAREAKDWARSDAIRDTLAKAGIVVEDSADGARWSLKA
jgi:cysteinyl-tRNA synthetase